MSGALDEVPGGQFWADLDEGLKDPAFRRAYVAAALEIATVDQDQGWTRGVADRDLIVYRLSCGHARLSRLYREEKNPLGKQKHCNPCGAWARIERMMRLDREDPG